MTSQQRQSKGFSSSEQLEESEALGFPLQDAEQEEMNSLIA